MMTSASEHNLSCARARCRGQQSIVKVLDNFLEAMDSMRHVIMVPSRLRDMEVQVKAPKNGSNGKSGLIIPKSTENGVATRSLDLFSCYSMLYAVQQELTCGGSGDLEDDLDSPTDDISRKMAIQFRLHLQELFTKLHQFTEVANYISQRYQDDVEIKLD